MTPTTERAAIIAEAMCPAAHGPRVCPACWAGGDRLAEAQERERRDRLVREGEQMVLFGDGKAVVGGE